jgi:hypothetical protein
MGQRRFGHKGHENRYALFRFELIPPPRDLNP